MHKDLTEELSIEDYKMELENRVTELKILRGAWSNESFLWNGR